MRYLIKHGIEHVTSVDDLQQAHQLMGAYQLRSDTPNDWCIIDTTTGKPPYLEIVGGTVDALIVSESGTRTFHGTHSDFEQWL
jgi:hypothetical protein